MNRNLKGQFIDGDNPGIATRFKRGKAPWNKGKQGYMGSNVTSFKKGNVPPKQLPEGTVTRRVVTRKNRTVEIYYDINIDWQGNRKAHNSYKWYLWEVENQRNRPKGHVLYIKNGNSDDLRTENFELISRSELMRRNHGI